MTATLGEFLTLAGDHIAGAVAFRGELPDSVRSESVGELGRLVAALARYLSDVPQPDPGLTGPRLPDPQAQATAEARIALRRAARSLGHGTALTQDAHPVARHLSAAATCLNAGWDLLQTHVTTKTPCTPAAGSLWAPIITSGPVTAALISELAQHARTLAPWAGQLTMTGPLDMGMPASERLLLHGAIWGLWITSAAVGQAQQSRRPAPEAHALLAAIPASMPPPRCPPADSEPVTLLCDGLTVTAERLRHTALASASSPAATSSSWRRRALASAITCHADHIILRTLTERASQLGMTPATVTKLDDAADAMNLAWPAWRAVAAEWDILSTGTGAGTGALRVAADLDDLVLRTGRLTYTRPDWTPGCATTSPARAAAELAPTTGAATAVLAAIHHGVDAIGRIGAVDQHAVQAAVASLQIYMPTRLLQERYDIPYPYTRAPRSRTQALLAAYATASSASTRATGMLDDLAAAIGAPSSILGVSRRLAGLHEDERQCAGDDPTAELSRSSRPPATTSHAAGMERLLDDLHITDPALLARAAAIDQASHDLLDEARAKATRREETADLQPQRTKRTPGRTVLIARKDLPERVSCVHRHGDRDAAPTTVSRHSTGLRAPSVQR